jgi:hypothetical protein
MSSVNARATLRVAELTALAEEHPMKRLYAFVTISSLVLSGPCIATPAGATWTDVTVRVYDSGALSDGNRREALAKAAAAFSTMLVAVQWSGGGHAQAPSGASCATPLRPGDFAIRLFAETFRLETAEG